MLQNLSYYLPIAPDVTIDQGDPFALTIPHEIREIQPELYHYYIFTTGEDPDNSRAVPCYGTNDFLSVNFLGYILHGAKKAAHWAPCVRYVPGLEYPWVMLVSHATGLGEESHVGHAIYRAHSRLPQGPYEYSGHILSPTDSDFAIDPEVYVGSDGQLRMAWATDFVKDLPLGTGIVEARINDDLTALISQPTTLARGIQSSQIYELNRYMPWKQIPGLDWDKGDRVAEWYTVEGPVWLTSSQHRPAMLYSTGNFNNETYQIWALVENDQGEMEDVSNTRGHVVLRSQPESNRFSMGHPSVIDEHHLLTHMRIGVDGPRQMAVVPIRRTPEGFPYVPDYTQVTSVVY
jgi:hypothetical protein